MEFRSVIPPPSQPAPASNLPPRYAPADHEPRIIEKWDAHRAFHADPGPVVRGEKKPYAVVIPPPNVTDRLHLGHALNNSLQDILVRAHRMMGFEAVWFPGTDHAGIGTQTKVDRTLIADGKPGIAHYKKLELEGKDGRTQFIDIVQKWKDKYEAEILGQLKRMGCSCDWERNRFTMDPICARAVREAFFRMFKDGLIYRGKRLVNWDPATQTALADDEVENKEVDGNFYYLRYPLVHTASGSSPPPLPSEGEDVASSRQVGGSSPVTWSDLKKRGYPANLIPESIKDTDQAFITVATTRPETYLGDTGVGVNPRDPRAKSLEGLHIQLPIVGRVIPIIADDYVVMPASISGSSDDPKAAFATGFLKITPAHDENDWALGLRHNLAPINVMAPDASISDKFGWSDIGEAGVFLSLSREDARREVVKALKAARVPGTDISLVEKVTPYRHSVGHSYRSHVPIEPYLSDQWYVKVTDDRLVGFAQRALRQSESDPSPGSATLRVASSLSLPLPSIAPPDFVPRDPYPPHEPKARGLIESLRNLPHLSLPDATYFVTWRTAGITLSEAERSIVVDSLHHWHGKTAQVYALCVMPDHVHAIVRPFDGLALGDWVASLKKFAAGNINAKRGTSGHLWQIDRFDHIVRDARWFSEFLAYILQNPVEEGLCADHTAYPWTMVDDAVIAAAEGKGTGRNSESCATTDSGDGALRIFPERYEKTYTAWHENLRDWCISRQLWWGHRIPVWHKRVMLTEKNWVDELSGKAGMDSYMADKSGSCAVRIANANTGSAVDPKSDLMPVVASTAGEYDIFVCCTNENDGQALAKFGFIQDPDVLDTWFSSGTWPLSTMGWPDPALAAKETGIADFPDLLKAFNPTDALCTAREIITLWVSRMVMFNRYFRSPDHGKTPGPVPFKDVFIHAMIQDGEGRKMSKSLGNGVDPLDIIATHGTDALRFVLCQMTTQTQDVRMPVQRDPATGRNTSPKFDIGRNFCTKLWNAARYALSNLEACPPTNDKQITRADLSLTDRWMLSRLESTVRAAEDSLRDYQFSAYATAMYDLLWRDYCDWYLEAVKPTLKSSPAQQAVVQCVLDAVLRLLHPICPFITEVLFESVAAMPARSIDGLILGRGATTLCRTAWPIADATLADPGAERDFARAQALVEAIRQAKSSAGVKNSEKLTLHATDTVLAVIRASGGVVEAVAGLAGATNTPASSGAIEVRFEGESLHLSGVVVVVDQGAERAGFEAAAAKLAKDIELIEKRLNNPGYMQKAPAHLVEETRGQLAAKVAEREDLLRRLESVR